MKFKYNFLENKLWKLDGEYSYEVSEDSQFHTNQGIYGTDVWSLGNQERIIFTINHSRFQVYYQIGTIGYQKVLDLPNTGEIIFEFTEQDLINNCEK